MKSGKLRYIRPGYMAKQVPEYERKKWENVEMNNIRMEQLGIRSMANALLDLSKKKTKKIDGKNRRLLDDYDETYQPPEDVDISHSNDEELVDFMNARKKRVIAPPTSTFQTEMFHLEPVMAPPLTINSTVDPTPTQEFSVEQDGETVITGSLPNEMTRASTLRRVRGATHGMNTEHLIVANNGHKLGVEIPLEVGQPVGEHAARFSSWIGVQVRMTAPLRDIEKWDDIPLACKAPIIQATRDKFEIFEYDDKEHVRRGVDRICRKAYRTWRYHMKEHYEALVVAGKDPYIIPYKGVTGEDWAWMIGNTWTNKDKEELVKKRKHARAQRLFDHVMGSKSYAAAMFAQTKNAVNVHIVQNSSSYPITVEREICG